MAIFVAKEKKLVALVTMFVAISSPGIVSTSGAEIFVSGKAECIFAIGEDKKSKLSGGTSPLSIHLFNSHPFYM